MRSIFPQVSLYKYRFQIHTNQLGGAEFKDCNCVSSLQVCIFLSQFCLNFHFIILKNNGLLGLR